MAMLPGFSTPLRLFCCLERKPRAFRAKAPCNLYMKKTDFAFQEVAALCLVRPHVTIPVPFVLDVVGGYFIMTGVRGKPLGTVFSEMKRDEVDSVRGSLSEFIHQLRAIPNDAAASGIVSGPHHKMPCCYVNYVANFQFGPFASTAAFHSHLLSIIPPQHREEPEASEAVRHGGELHTVYFTHGSPNLNNILVEDGQVTGIVDWMCTGWYPGDWELAIAVYFHQRFKKWRDLWATILPDYEEEL